MDAERLKYLKRCAAAGKVLPKDEPEPTATEWPDELLRPEGIVGEIAKWITESAIRPQPRFSLAAALSVCGILLGRGVKDATGQLTNLYCLALGLSNGGKDAPSKITEKLLMLTGREKLLTGKLTSDSALELLLDDYPVRFMRIDEVGHYLGSLKNAGTANAYLRTVMPVLTDCWSIPSREGVFIGKGRAPDSNGKWRPPRKIRIPVVGIYGTGSPDRLFESIEIGDLRDGALPRWLYFESRTFPARNLAPPPPVPPELLQRLKSALNKLGLTEDKYNSPDAVAPEPRTIPETPEATEVFAAFAETTDNDLRRAEGDPVLYIWGKACENARRVALTVACLRNPDHPAVDRYSAEYGVRLVTACVRDLITAVRRNVAGSKRERDSLTLENIIRRAGTITRSELTLRTRAMDRRDRTAALLDLLDAGIVEEKLEIGSGKKDITSYVYIGCPLQ